MVNVSTSRAAGWTCEYVSNSGDSTRSSQISLDTPEQDHGAVEWAQQGGATTMTAAATVRWPASMSELEEKTVLGDTSKVPCRSDLGDDLGG
ncbi:hypothetical protein VTO73DRAFT_14511 [Trametes versicolor]